MKPILHVTHRKADPDSFAGVLWGLEVFGGCALVHQPNRIVRNLIEEMKIELKECGDYRRVFAYDVDSPEKLPINAENLVVFDHHSRNSFEGVDLKWRPRASLSMNLFDISSEAGYELSDGVLFSFAVALVTDTSVLRTATSEELYYLSVFLKNRRMEDVFRVIFRGAVKMEPFLKDLESVGKSGSLCYGKFSSEDHFTFFCDTFMYSLECSVVIGELDWGVWFFSEKRFVQRLFHFLKELEKMGYERKGGKVIGMKIEEALRFSEDLLQLSG